MMPNVTKIMMEQIDKIKEYTKKNILGIEALNPNYIDNREQQPQIE